MDIIIGYLKAGIVVEILGDAYIVGFYKEVPFLELFRLNYTKKFLMEMIINILLWPRTVVLMITELYENIMIVGEAAKKHLGI